MYKLLCKRFFATSISAVKTRSPPGVNISPYAMFIKEQVPKQPQGEITTRFKKTIEMWRSLGEAEKQKYADLAAKYREQKIAEFNKLSEAEKQKAITAAAEAREARAKRREKKERREEWEKTNHPALPLSAHKLYIQEQFALKKKNNESVSPVTEVLKQMNSEWKVMSAASKEKYNKQAEKLQNAYKAEITEWKQKQKQEKKKSASA